MKLKKIIAGTAAAAMLVTATISGSVFNFADADAVVVLTVTKSNGLGETAQVSWDAFPNADAYNVYVKPDGGTYSQIDSMLITQRSDAKFTATAVGLKAGTYSMKIVAVKDGKETSNTAEVTGINVSAYDRSGFGWTNGSSSGAYNEDGTLKSNAVVLYLTEATKDTVSMDVVVDSKGTVSKQTGIQNILNYYKKGYDKRPLNIRIIGTVTDPSVLEGGDLVISGNGDTKRLSSGITIEGIGNDAVINGFGIRLKNVSNCEVRNIGVMLVDSSEGDNITLQQSCDHVWVHNCDSFYGMPGGDADQAKGDGALDCKKSTYITFSYNHFWDNGKCNLLGLSEDTTDGLYITYHHNWYDHSDSRHPRIRFYSAHVYNNYYDGNAKYGIGSTLGSSVFSENNYFRNCKYPMLTSMQGSDIDPSTGKGTFSSEDGGTIKSYGNYMEGQKAFVPYSENNVEFDAYVASSRDEKIPATVKSKKGSNTYNNFDTDSSVMYSYTPDAAEDVPSKVKAGAGRQNGGDFSFTFNNETDDTDYSVNASLMASLKAYKSSIIAIGSGFDNDLTPEVTTTAVTTPVVTTTKASSVSVVTSAATKTTTKTSSVSVVVVTSAATKTTTKTTTVTTKTTPAVTVDESAGVIFCSPSGKSSAAGTQSAPMDVLTAISKVKAGGVIYLLGGTYKFDKTILIDENNNGTANGYKSIVAYNGADVVWDFSAQGTSSSNRGVVLDGDYWHFKGFEITKAGDNGVLLAGSNNIFELMEFNDNQDTGLQISRYNTSAATIDLWPANNLILNCTAKNNCDDATMENADGFAAKLTCGEGNVFDGCMAYNNSDDGWDLFAKAETGPIGVVTIRNCIAFRNGYTEFGEGFGDCDGNGFKLGGSGIGSAHIIENCLAFENLNCGFTDNNNPKLGSITNCTAYNNGVGGNGKPNISCYRCTDDGCDFKNVISYINASRINNSFEGISQISHKIANDKFVGTMENSIYYNSKYYNVTDKINITNGAKIGAIITPTDDMFVSLEVAPFKIVSDAASAYAFHKEWRNADGSINTNGFLEIKESSEYNGIGSNFTNAESGPIVTPVKGDLNGDGIVSVLDIHVLENFLTKKAVSVTSAYDVDENGKVNVFDLCVLKRICK